MSLDTIRECASAVIEPVPEKPWETEPGVSPRNNACRVIHECLRERGAAFEDAPWESTSIGCRLNVAELIRRVS